MLRLIAWLDTFFTAFKSIAFRFPIPVIIAALLTFLLLGGVYQKLDVKHAALMHIALFVASVGAVLFGEARRMRPDKLLKPKG